MDNNENKKKSIISFQKLLIGTAVVCSAALGSIAGLNAAKNDGNLSTGNISANVNITNQQVPTEAKDCALIALKTMQVVSNRTLAATSFEKQAKEDKKIIEDLIRPLAEKNGKGVIDIYNPNEEDIKAVLSSCMNKDGYLERVNKAAHYVITTFNTNQSIAYNSLKNEDENKISIKINKPTQQDGATISYKLKT